MMAEIKIPPILRIGGGSLAGVAAILLRLRCSRPLMVTDPFLMKTSLLKNWQRKYEMRA